MTLIGGQLMLFLFFLNYFASLNFYLNLQPGCLYESQLIKYVVWFITVSEM
jgi:hypothetical protein